MKNLTPCGEPFVAKNGTTWTCTRAEEHVMPHLAWNNGKIVAPGNSPLLFWEDPPVKTAVRTPHIPLEEM